MANLEHLYKNPFSDYNANSMDSKKILDYWCSPFNFIHSPGVSESDIYKNGNPIVFMGGRGSGKTMFLKYWSYQVQRDKVLSEHNVKTNPILKRINALGGIGFYIRIDGPVLRSFSDKGVSPEKWDAIFTHYFELYICRSYIEVIVDLVKKSELKREDIEDKFVPEIARCLGCEGSKSIEDLLSTVEDRIREVTSFRGEISFTNIDFRPTKGFSSQDLSFCAADICRNFISELKNINFIVFIDEYENFLDSQQRMVNTLIKFVKKGISLRIGMRLQGFHTFATISENEFIKVGRDYQEFVFENVLLKDKDYSKFLFEVAKKRLESVPEFALKGFTNIINFLGEKENLEDEARELISKRRDKKKHFGVIDYNKKPYDKDKIIEDFSITENPLLEMLNVLKLVRNEDPKEIKKMMSDYIMKKTTKESIKYKLDYIDKYKLTLMFLLASIYKGNKKYYSFNTYSFLSSGIVGNFIEMCRRAFQNAYFEDKESIMHGRIISKDIQDKAARETADSEFRMITRIPKYGDSLYLLAKNLGNSFRAYHVDNLARYPETNQFSVDIASVEEERYKYAFNAALEWSIIQKKPGLQRTSPSSPRGDIYTLNRVFSPIFEITYRTRGGYSIEYNKYEIKKLMTEENIKPMLLHKEPKYEDGKEKKITESDDHGQQRFKF